MPHQFRDLHWRKDISVKEYLFPRTLGDALDLLEKYDGRALVIAGGTDVIPRLRHRDLEVEALVDITRLPELNAIEQKGNDILVGGLVTHAQAASSPLLRNKAAILCRGAGSVGSPQIRNIATVAGNLVSGHPAADTSIPLLALDATVTVASKEGERMVRLPEFFLDKGKTAMDCRREILTQIRFPAMDENQGGCHLRLSKRRSLTISVLVLAAVVGIDSRKGIVREAAIAMGPVASIPFRASRAEALLQGAPICEETIQKASETACMESRPVSSPVWGSAEYKKEMVRVFVRRGLRNAFRDAGFPVP